MFEAIYKDEIKEDIYLFDLIKKYEKEDVSVEELLRFSDVVNYDRSMPALETLQEWNKYHNYFNN